MTRRRVLVAGAAGAAGALPVVGPGLARAAKPLTPVGDDIGFLQVGALAELLCVSAYRAAAVHPDFTPRQRRWLDQARAADKLHYSRLSAPLGADAPKFGDYRLGVTAERLRRRSRVVDVLQELERICAGVYISGVANSVDPGTRELLGRLIAADTQHLAAIGRISASAPFTGELPPALDVAQAGDRLDRFIGDLFPDR